MTDPTPIDREAIRRRARRQAERMGLRTRPEAEAPQPVLLPTDNPFVLRGLLTTGRLTREQETAAIRMLADRAAAERQTPDHTPGDAA